jgi:hypothetical protein
MSTASTESSSQTYKGYEKKLKEFTEYLEIDKHDLDNVVTQQASLFFEVSRISAVVSSLEDNAKQEFKTVEAEVNLDIREDCLNKNIKTTENFIAALILCDDRYIRASRDYIYVCREAEKWKALKDAFIQRSFMIRELSSLLIAGYYTQSTINGDPAANSEAKYDRLKNNLAEKRSSKV